MTPELESNYPLQWPAGWPVTSAPGTSRFGEGGRGVSMIQALDYAEAELRRLGAVDPVISSNLRPRRDGRPYADQPRPVKGGGVAIYFTLKKRRLVLACDLWRKPEENLWAIAKHVEALRGQQRWGVGSIEQAFAGYAALPPKRGQDCWETLGLAGRGNAPTEQEVIAAWRDLAKVAHPDVEGGSAEAFQRLNDAKAIALATIAARQKPRMSV